MTIPPEYQRAYDHFHDFLVDVRDFSDLVTINQAYTTAQGVLQTFRRRLDLRDAIRFAQLLPAGVRARFVMDWDPDEPKQPFQDIETMTKEVQSLRADHNFAPSHAISAVARALRKRVDEHALDRLLRDFPPGAFDFWQP